MSKSSDKYHKKIIEHNMMLESQKSVNIICSKCKQEKPLNTSMSYVGDIILCYECTPIKYRKNLGYWRF